MAVRLPRPVPDDRMERILRDPQGYFADARKRIRAEVEEEMRQERSRQSAESPQNG